MLRRLRYVFDLTDCYRDLPASQVHATNSVNSLPRLRQFFPRQHALEHSARRSKADDNDVPRVGDIAAEKLAHYAEPHFLCGLSIRGPISAAAGNAR